MSAYVRCIDGSREEEHKVNEYVKVALQVLTSADPVHLIRTGGDVLAYDFIATRVGLRLNELEDMAIYVDEVVFLLHETLKRYFEHRYTWVPFDWISHARQITDVTTRYWQD